MHSGNEEDENFKRKGVFGVGHTIDERVWILDIMVRTDFGAFIYMGLGYWSGLSVWSWGV